MRIVLIGANGQLAYDLIPVLQKAGHGVVGLAHAQIEISSLDSVRASLKSSNPQLVINTAAYHRVDEVEENPDRAFAVNSVGMRNLAIVCKELGSSAVYLSTDYVFSGRKKCPYVESDPVDPLNSYGISKAAGEMLLRYLLPRHFIVRTTGLYGVAGSSGKGSNFVESMLRLAKEGRAIRVVSDQTLTPTSTQALAAQIGLLIETEAYGTYHATCQGSCSWFEFAAEIFRLSSLSTELKPQTTAESQSRAVRPSYSVLDNANLRQLGIDRMPSWQEALTIYLRERVKAATTARSAAIPIP